ncbi:MAG: tetratricopeptide repeat protein [Spirochaetia bacterium]
MGKKDLVLVILIVITAAVLTATLLYIQNLRESRISTSHVDILREIDNNLSDGYIDRAEDSILSLSDKSVSAATYLQLLKRALRIAEERESYDTFLEVAREGHSEYSAREDIAALLVFAYLREGNTEKAWEIASDSTITDTRWDPVLSEAALAAGSLSGEEDENMYADLLSSRDPERFIEAWETTNSESFLLDAVLLYLRDGQVYRASDLVQQLPRDCCEKLRFFIAWDLQDWRKAREILTEVPTNDTSQGLSEEEKLMLGADISLHLGEHERAAEMYRQLQEEYPDYSWKAFYNLEYIRYEYGAEEEESGDFREELYTLAEEKTSRVIDLAELMLAYGDTDSTEDLLSEESLFSESDPHISLLKEAAKDKINPERYKSLLRVLVNRSEGEKYASHLAWFLMGMEDYDGLEELVTYYESTHGESGRLYFYKGVIQAEEGSYGEALSSFSRSLDRDEHWQTYYNMALVEALQNDPGRAVSLLDSALERAEDSPEESAAIMAKRAEINYRNQRYSNAEADLEKALDLDPTNTNAHLILNALEAEE